jgi:GNAT superfamily N-acetyltransferase
MTPAPVDDAWLIDAIEQNFVEYTLAGVRLCGGEWGADEGLTWAHAPTRLAYYNGVIQTRLDDITANERIAAFIEQWRNRRYVWWAPPSARPADLAERLDQFDFTRRWQDIGMAADLAELPESVPLPPDVTIAPARDPVERLVWAATSQAGFETPADLRADFMRNIAPHLPLDDPDFALYLARQAGEPVAASVMFCDARVVGVCDVSVTPAARRQGLGAAVTHAVMRAGQERGRRYAVLQASPMGQPVYERLGFRALCALDAFLWEP